MTPYKPSLAKKIPEILDFLCMITSNLTSLWDIFFP